MDQVKIGNFIADLRKEKKMTQKELAEAIGVSNKAVSKWENGNGMPEMSILMPLCQELQINVNELLSGERLSENSYSRKAEENIMNLMQEKEENKKQHKKDILVAALMFGVMLCTILAVIVWIFIALLGVDEMYKARWYLIDWFLLLPMLVTAVLALCVTRLMKPFFRVFGLLFSHRKYSVSEVKESVIALRMTGNVWMVTGILVTALGLILCFQDFFWMTAGMTDMTGAEYIKKLAPITFIDIANVSLGLFYGAVGKLFLLPIQSKLESIAQKLTDQA